MSGRFFALGQDIAALIPKLPYQIALKLMTFHEPPVGIEAGREDGLPRQMYDLDVLLAQLDTREQWNTLADYSVRRYIKEERQRSRTPASDGPWLSIGGRLSDWAHTADTSLPYGQLIRAFQASQVAAGAIRSTAEWRGRARRLQFAVRELANDQSGYRRWQRALTIEARITEPAGPNLRNYRRAIASVTGAAPRTLGQFPRVPFWEHLALCGNVDVALDALDHAL